MKKFLLTSLILSASLFANEAPKEEAVYEYENPSGVEVRFNEDGEVKSLLATADADYKFGDSKDIKQATQKATMRAKANLSKFLQEEVSTSEVQEEITTTISSDSSEGESSAIRDSVEKFAETVSVESKALLSGVVVLKSEVLKDDKMVRVTVGLKEQTINAAAAMSMKMSEAQAKMAQAKEQVPVNKAENLKDSNVKKSQMYDNF